MATAFPRVYTATFQQVPLYLLGWRPDLWDLGPSLRIRIICGALTVTVCNHISSEGWRCSLGICF